jgi:hypothetical protein
MAQPRTSPESASDRCFACSGAISAADLAVYLYGAWFHLPCYERENNFPNDPKPVPRGARRQSGPSWSVMRLIQWITDTSPRPPSLKDPVAVELGRRGGLKGGRVRAARLSPAQRAAIARRAARARWDAAKER